jgi:DNA polymerase I-like protein with 3'-5' exonuclease and polymerase domains
MASFLGSLFARRDRIVAHNLKFELLVIYQHFEELRPQLMEYLESEGKLFCTLLYETLINNVTKKETMKFNLAALVQKYFKVDISEGKKDPDAWRYRYSELRGVPQYEWPAEAVEYAIEDSKWALAIYKKQLESNDTRFKYHTHVQADFALNLMAATGLLVSKERVKQLEDEIITITTPKYADLEAGGFLKHKKDGSVTKNMKAFREYVSQNFTTLERTDSGQVSTSNESLGKYLAEKDDLVVQSFLDVMAKEKIRTAFVERLKEADPVIRTNYDVIKRSGRTSSKTSSAYPSVNIQQMPRGVEGVTYDVRACFVPREGFEMVSIDYSGLELTATANQLVRVFKRSKMADAINGGDEPVDMHSKLACKLMSIKKRQFVSYEEFMAHKKEPEFKAFRQLAKPINLGFPGGIGYDTMRHLLVRDGLVTKFEILERFTSEQRAMHILHELRIQCPNLRVKRTGIFEWSLVFDELVGLKNALFDLYPELGQFLRKEHSKYTNGDYIASKNEFGQWETEPAYCFDTSGVRRDYCTYTAFCNGYLMQTPAAVGAKAAVYNLMKEFHDSRDLIPLAFIHDEIIFEVRADAPNKFPLIDRVAEIMIDSMQRALPNVRVAAEASLMDWWSKSGGKWEAQYWKDVRSTQLNKKEL